MDFTLPDTVELLRRTVRRFAEEHVKPVARKIDRENEFPRELYKKMVEAGINSPRIPQEYGGPGLSVLETVIVGEELARASGSAGLIAGVQTLATNPLIMFGNEDVKRKYLGAVAKGEKIGAFALTEPEAGSDAGSIRTVARRDSGGFVIEGVKTYITCGTVADFFLVFARTSDLSTRHRGITAFIVDRDETVETSKLEVMGFRGTGTAEVRFKGTWVPEDNVVGEINGGFRVAMFSLDESRIYAAAGAVGLAEAAFEEAFEWARSRVAFGKPIVEHQMIQQMLTEMITNIEAMKLLTYKAAWLRDRGDFEYVKLASAAKLFAAQKCVEVARMAVQVLGGFGYSKESESERIYRDAKLFEIGEGTNEIQRIVLMRALLGKISL